MLLKSMILSLALSNPVPRPDRHRTSETLSLILVDPKGHTFAPFERLPHLARPIIREIGEITEALQSLVRLMERYTPSSRRSHVVLVIDELADILMTGGKPIEQALARLTQRGREANIHIVAATQKPSNDILGPLIKSNFPARIVGMVTSASDARTATGWTGTGAERLLGKGDFLAVAEGQLMRFQAAYVSQKEIEGAVAELCTGSPLVQQAALPWPLRRLASATEILR
jgi:S-DNA-T family DNA segregation ATPase FtsK/SpoIIIE